MKKVPMKGAALVAAFFLPASMSQAKICDYKPSRLIGGATSAIVGGAVSATASAGVVTNALGYYTLVHATSGLTMLGSTAAGSSAAGTVGIIAGTGGVIGSALAFVTAPATIVVGAVTAVALGGYEGACYFKVERVTDRKAIVAIVENMAQRAEPDYFRLISPRGLDERFLVVRDVTNPEIVNRYDVDKLYIADGVLKHRDSFMNTTIGKVLFIDEAPPEQVETDID
ncbi:hypothetical protein JSE7799_01160 [Jannaschia seosinensis]|uniref:Glycine zipper domain-containing protein n=1 Tax=Jannaschia seosinensis TaxID=313367 RepID=A0A0M7BAT9_9RHOB|nr:hypothetical protein [Jannaschia seosinensis]CUH35871.1 hypothetical protein JSE7799_01160 [Jannaschia seosinensis]